MRLPIFDPQSVPIDSVAGEAAIDQSRLDLSWIRHRLENPPQWQPEIFAEHQWLDSDKKLTDASILIALLQRETGLNLLFTRRTAHLSQHAGQISFPGGRVDKEDQSVIDTALRETHEEIGVDKQFLDVLGTLPNYCTVTGYRVTPVVAAVKSLPVFLLNPNEVDEIFEVPLAYLMNGAVHQRRSIIFPDQQQRRSFYAISYQQYFIWGATAGILRNLFHLLRA